MNVATVESKILLHQLQKKSNFVTAVLYCGKLDFFFVLLYKFHAVAATRAGLVMMHALQQKTKRKDPSKRSSLKVSYIPAGRGDRGQQMYYKVVDPIAALGWTNAHTHEVYHNKRRRKMYWIIACFSHTNSSSGGGTGTITSPPTLEYPRCSVPVTSYYVGQTSR